MTTLQGKVAAITGAASGIGRAMAVRLVAEGCAIALADLDRNGLEETAQLIGESGSKVTTHRIDVADLSEVRRFADEAVRAHGHVDLSINNAAVVVVDSLEDVAFGDFEWLMGTNFWGVVYGTKVFLPYLKQRPEAHIVNVSSISALVAAPNNGPYCAAKCAVLGFTEALSQELQGTSVKVSCVLPGGVKTNIHRNARFFKQMDPCMGREDSIQWFERTARTCPARAAEEIVEGIKKNKARILIGSDARVLDWMKRLFPVWTTRFVAHLCRRMGDSRWRMLVRR
jgi:NAD(P)-dependent dehydrogenase (short-subunit alcohol dehydrogenase family)